MNTKFAVLLLALAVLLIGSTQVVFTVDEREQAIVLQFGRPTGDIKGPGLHFKVPVIQSVTFFDRRILSVDPQPTQMVISSGHDNPLVPGGEEAPENNDEIVSGEPIVVDTFARYKITDPLKFLRVLRTVSEANQRIETIINDATRSVLGRTTLRDLLSEERTRVMNDIRSRVNRVIEEDDLGIEIVDIRIVRADLTPELRQSTVRRMISELKERATETRAKGEEKALEIRSTAEKEKTVILAEAQRDSQIIRGEGDREAIKIYADAFNKDPEFYAFIRSMEAYKNTLSSPETKLILSPESDFFRFFGESDGER